MLFLLLLLPLIAAEPIFSRENYAEYCKDRDSKPHVDGDFFKSCKSDVEMGSRVEVLGCKSVSGVMLNFNKEKFEGRIYENCTKIGNQASYHVETLDKHQTRPTTTTVATITGEPANTVTNTRQLADSCSSHHQQTFSIDGIVYNCRWHSDKPQPVGCLPVMALMDTYNSFIPMGREVEIVQIKERCDLLPNRTAAITLKHSHPTRLDFDRQLHLTKTLPVSCYFNGREMPEGSAVRIGKVTLACVKVEGYIQLRFIGCYDDQYHHDIKQNVPQFVMAANCEEPGVVDPNAPSEFEYYNL